MAQCTRPLVIRFGRLGDSVLLQPLLQRLQQRYGQPCDLLAIGGWPAALYAHRSEVGEIVALESPRRLLLLSPERLRAVLWLRQRREAPVYVCEPQPRALLRIEHMLDLAGIPMANRAYFTDLALREGEHWVDHLLRFAEVVPPAFRGNALTPKVTATGLPAPRLQATAQAREDCERWLSSRGWDGRPLVLLQPANKRSMRWNGVRALADDDKAWPVQHWAALAWAISEAMPEARVLLCGSPREADYLEDIRTVAASESVAVAADDLPLPRLMALLEGAHSMVSVDTGPAHMAAALGCPLLVMFGGASPTHWAPRPVPGGVVQVLGGATREARVASLSVEQVVAAWRELASRGASTDVAAA